MNVRRYDLVMAVFPNARGFAYVVFEGPLSPIDWGMSDVHGVQKNRKCIELISVVVRRHMPEVLVIRTLADDAAGRNHRLGRLLEAIETLAETQSIATFKFSRDEVRRSFQYLRLPTRYTIVQTIAKCIPMFEQFVPPVRKIWKNEDRRMGLFDAAALVLTFYSRQSDDPGVAMQQNKARILGR